MEDLITMDNVSFNINKVSSIYSDRSIKGNYDSRHTSGQIKTTIYLDNKISYVIFEKNNLNYEEITNEDINAFHKESILNIKNYINKTYL